MPARSTLTIVAAAVLASTIAAWGGAQAQGRLRPIVGASGQFEVTDRVDLVHVDQQLLAIRGETGAVLEIPLEVGERVIDIQSGGLMGVASTSNRLLGITAASPDWTVLRYRVSERERGVARIYVQDRVAVASLPHRLVALNPSLKTWIRTALSPGESQPEILTGAQLAVAITPRRALGFSDQSSRFAEIQLGPRERIQRRSVEDSSITLVTERRVLVFRAGAASWVEVDRKKRG